VLLISRLGGIGHVEPDSLLSPAMCRSPHKAAFPYCSSLITLRPLFSVFSDSGATSTIQIEERGS